MMISVIVPCYNEGSSLIETYKEIVNVLQSDIIKKKYEYEVIFVNDGSKDDTLNNVKRIASIDTKVKYISFSRNFGKESGMIAGLEYSKGDAVIIMDADLQHPPSLLPELIEHFEEGYNQVIAKRSRSGEKFIRKHITKAYYKIINKIIDVELVDGIGDFRLLSRKAVNSLLKLPEYNRFSKALFSWIGYESKVIEYENKERVFGESKWSMGSLLNYAIDGMISFNSKPLRGIIYIGVVITLISIFYILYSFFKIIIVGIESPGYFTLISSILLLGGLHLISIGVLGEYVGRIFYEVKQRPHYIVDETNIKDDK